MLLFNVWQWLKRLDVQRGEQSRHERNNATIVSHEGYQYVVLTMSPLTGSNHVTAQTTTHGDGTFTSRLVVDRVGAADSGLYVCVVIGPHGGRTFRSAFLNVVLASGKYYSSINKYY